MDRPQQKGLYDPRNEHDACGVGFVANIKNRKSHPVDEQGPQIQTNHQPHATTPPAPLLGDGAGTPNQRPDT